MNLIELTKNIAEVSSESLVIIAEIIKPCNFPSSVRFFLDFINVFVVTHTDSIRNNVSKLFRLGCPSFRHCCLYAR